MLYIPRALVAEDTILGEDRLSEFKHAYPINIYVETMDSFGGQNSFASKFGLQIESTAIFQISKSSWGKSVGQHGTSVLPNRPSEGDLIYANFNKGLFEIKFVDHQSPFYQLGQFYTYKLSVELFRYSSEKISTGIPEVDIFEQKFTQDTDQRLDPDESLGHGNADNNKFTTRAEEFIANNPQNPFGSF